MKEKYIILIDTPWWLKGYQHECDEIIHFLIHNNIKYQSTEYTLPPHHSVIFNGIEVGMDNHDAGLFKLTFTNKLLNNSSYSKINHHG